MHATLHEYIYVTSARRVDLGEVVRGVFDRDRAIGMKVRWGHIKASRWISMSNLATRVSAYYS